MTREEAIETLEANYPDACFEQLRDAVDAAIFALKQPEIIRCKDCEHFHYDMPYVIQGVAVRGHEVCDFWSGGCKTAEDGFCSYAERKDNG